jgi:hypothetical protein
VRRGRAALLLAAACAPAPGAGAEEPATPRPKGRLAPDRLPEDLDALVARIPEAVKTPFP